MKKNVFLSSMVLLSAALFAEDACNPCPEMPLPKLENCRCYNLFGFGEFLYWRYSSANLSYGRTGVGVIQNPAVQVPVTEGTSYEPDFKYDPGFRVGIGIKFGRQKKFDLVGIYTRLYTNPKGSISGTPLDNTFVPLNWFNSTSTANNVYSFAGEKLNLYLNYAELQSGYGFGINRYFGLRPYIALCSYIMKGYVKVQYDYTTPASVFTISKTNGSCSAWSIGPKVGIDIAYHMSDSWGIYTNFNITQQFAHITMDTTQTQDLPATGTHAVVQRGHVVQIRNTGLFGLEIGPTWEDWFFDQSIHVYIRATYGASTLTGGEHLSFLNSNNLNIGANGEIRGLNVRALVEF